MTESEEVASEPEETSDSGDLEEEESVRHGVVTVTTNNVKVGIYILQSISCFKLQCFSN